MISLTKVVHVTKSEVDCNGPEHASAPWDPIDQWLLKLRGIGKAVIMIHHAGKTSGYRGHSGKTDNLDNVIHLDPKAGTDRVHFDVKFIKKRLLKPGQAKKFTISLVDCETHRQCLTWKMPDEGVEKNKQVKILLLSNKVTQEKIAEQTGISQPRVSNIKKKLTTEGYLKNSSLTRTGRKWLKANENLAN